MTDSSIGRIILEEWQVRQFIRIGDLIRGDWSGFDFDGRDVKKWITATLDGKNIDDELLGYENR